MIIPTTPKAHSNSSEIFSQLRINLISSEDIIQYARTFAPQVQKLWNQAHAFLVESFPKTPRTRPEASWLSGSHNYKTKQNKIPSFMDR
jgi:hypothetical protein